MPALNFIPDWQKTAMTAANSNLGGMYRGAKQGAMDDMSRFNGTMGGAQNGILGGLARQYAQQGAQTGRDIGVKAGDWMFQGGQNDLNRTMQQAMQDKQLGFEDKWAQKSLQQRQQEMGQMGSMASQNGWMGLLGTTLGAFGGPALGAAGGAFGNMIGNSFGGGSGNRYPSGGNYGPGADGYGYQNY